MKALICFLVDGLSAFSTAIILSGFGCSLSFPSKCPKHSKFLYPMQVFEGLAVNPAYGNLLKFRVHTIHLHVLSCHGENQDIMSW